MKRKLFLTTLVVTLIAFAKASFGQIPPLGTVGSFALFTITGAVTNTGPSTSIYGDIGTNVGAITGYTNVTGQSYIADITTAQAAIDTRKAYDYLVALPRGASAGPAFGAGQVLLPGVYSQDGAASIAGDLYLDGQNNPNASFIFKFGGAFTVGAGSRVILLNSANSGGVFWQVNGAATVAANSVFVGTIIANGAVGLSDGTSMQGRALSVAGAITNYNNQVVRPTIIASVPLPVALTSFTAMREGNVAQLRWATATERNSAYYAVERSAAGQVFAEVGRVAAQGGSAQVRVYTWAESAGSLAAGGYYRLRLVDIDGTVAYSSVCMLAPAPRAGITELQLVAYPNPGRAGFSARVEVSLGGAGTLRVFDAHGALVAERTLALAAGSTELALPEVDGLRPGLYRVQLQLGTQRQALTLVHE